MDIEWEVEDGYVGKGRPQLTENNEIINQLFKEKDE